MGSPMRALSFVIKQAIARKHPVAFFHIDGPVTPDESTKRWLEAAIAASAAHFAARPSDLARQAAGDEKSFAAAAPRRRGNAYTLNSDDE